MTLTPSPDFHRVAILVTGLMLLTPRLWADVWGSYPGLDALVERTQAIVIADITPPAPVDPKIYDPSNGTVSGLYEAREVIVRRNLKGDLPEGQRLTVGVGLADPRLPNQTILSYDPDSFFQTASAINFSESQFNILPRYQDTHDRMKKDGKSGTALFFLIKNPNPNEPYPWQNVNVSGAVLDIDPKAVKAPLVGTSFGAQLGNLIHAYPRPTPPESRTVTTPDAATQQKLMEWVLPCWEELTSIIPGMTRADVAGKKLILDGGLRSKDGKGGLVRYCHAECPYLKIQVIYSSRQTPNKKYSGTGAPDDPVLEVSKPYIELPIAD